MSKRTMLIVGVAAVVLAAAGAGKFALAQQPQGDVIGELANNEGIFVDGKTFKIARGKAKGDPAALSDEERDIVTYVRQLMRTNRVDQAVFDRLKNRHDSQWMVELTEVANYFAFLSGMVNPFEVPAPPDGDKLPS